MVGHMFNIYKKIHYTQLVQNIHIHTFPCINQDCELLYY